MQAILLVLFAAIMNAAYALPMKLNKKWEWEHSWFAFSILGVAVVPTMIALLTVPGLWSTYSRGLKRDVGGHGVVRRQLGRVAGLFWLGADSFGSGHHFCSLSWNLGRGRRAHSTDRSALPIR